MKFKIEVKVLDDGSSHWEMYDTPINDAHKWAEELIEWFNGTTRPGESKRELLSVELL